MIVVDDGSNDGTAELMAELRSEPAGRPLPAPAAELREVGRAAGRPSSAHTATSIVLMDADGQDEPEEIPQLLAALDGGLDLVTGRRVQRNDRFVKRHDLAPLQRASPPRSPA